MDLVSDFGSFVASVGSQWQALVTGSFLTALVFVVERWRDRQVPRRTSVGLFLWLYLILATFLAWRTERERFDELDLATSDAQSLTVDQEDRIVRVLRQGKGSSLSLGILSHDRRGREFAQRVQALFQKAGWSLGTGGADSSGSGRSLRILAENVNTPAASLIMTAFTEGNLRYRVFRVCQGTPVRIEIGESEIETGRPTTR